MHHANRYDDPASLALRLRQATREKHQLGRQIAQLAARHLPADEATPDGAPEPAQHPAAESEPAPDAQPAVAPVEPVVPDGLPTFAADNVTLQNATTPPVGGSPVLQDATDCYNFALQNDASPADAAEARQAVAVAAELRLSPSQKQAIELLALGRTDQVVANLLRVHRVTVARWRLYNPVFAAALNRRRHEVWGAAGDRFRAMLEKAFDVLDRQLLARQEDVCLRAARLLIWMAGTNRFSPKGLPTSARDVIDDFVRVRRKDLLDDRPITEEDREAALAEMLRKAEE